MGSKSKSQILWALLSLEKVGIFLLLLVQGKRVEFQVKMKVKVERDLRNGSGNGSH